MGTVPTQVGGYVMRRTRDWQVSNSNIKYYEPILLNKKLVLIVLPDA